MRGSSAVLIGWCLMLMPLTGCFMSPDPSPAQPETMDVQVMRATAADCLESLRLSYIERDVAGFAALLSHDFTFVFDPSSPEVPPQWDREDELAATQNMFGGETVEGITLTFRQGLAVPSDDEYPGTWKVEVDEVRLSVFLRTGYGEILELRASDAGGVFYLKPATAVDVLEQRPRWKVWRWEDIRPLGADATESYSWGEIKTFFR